MRDLVQLRSFSERQDRTKRRALIILGAAIAAAPRRLLGQGARRPRIGYLLVTPLTEPPSLERQAFLDGLLDQGYVPGTSVEIVYRSAEGEADFIDDTCRDLLARNPDVIVVSGAISALSAKRATRSVPIVMLAVGDPVGIGAVSSLAKPGGNVTGVSFISSDLAPKRLQFAKECVPRAKKLTSIWDSRNANARAESGAVLAAAKQFDLSVESLGLASDAELARALHRLASAKPEILYVAFEGGLASANRTTLAEFGLRQRVPIVSGWSSITEAGALLSYAPDIPAMFRRAAYYVARVLKGAKPAALPIELPTKVDLVINLRTARRIGVSIPREMLLRADRVIE
ncbi:MAG: ABC transporter substrate-binding protein [Burkholderiales bacterium]